MNASVIHGCQWQVKGGSHTVLGSVPKRSYSSSMGTLCSSISSSCLSSSRSSFPFRFFLTGTEASGFCMRVADSSWLIVCFWIRKESKRVHQNIKKTSFKFYISMQHNTTIGIFIFPWSKQYLNNSHAGNNELRRFNSCHTQGICTVFSSTVRNTCPL